MELNSNCSSDDYFAFRQSNSSACVIWKVKDFSTVEEKCYTSPAFILKEAAWHLSLYPFGSNDKNSGYVGLFLTPHSSVSLEVKFQFIVKNEDGEDKITFRGTDNFSDGLGHGFGKVFKRQDVLDGKLGDLWPNDVLTVCCKIKIVENLETETETFTGIGKVSPNSVRKCERNPSFLSKLRQQLESGKFSDVVLRVGEDTIPAHKVILSSHSEVFQAMFESNLKENQESVVDVIDMDSTVAKAMLLYMYTNEVETLSTAKTLELYIAADKYMMTELKEKCREYVSENMSSENVGDAFEIAKLHSDVFLSKAAKNFFARNVKCILASKAWKEFSAQKPSTSVELLSYAIKINDFLF